MTETPLRGLLAYLFWHQPAANGEPARYQAALADFQRSLMAVPEPGIRAAWSWRLAAPPWWPADGAAVYLDWYVVDGFASLERLNAAAVSGRRAEPHAQVAAAAGHGTGALFGQPEPDIPVRWPTEGSRARLLFVDKPRGVAYPSTIAALAAAGGQVWVRQMVLGPGAEFVVIEEALDDRDGPPDDRPPVGALQPVWAAHAVCVCATVAPADK